MGRNRRTGRLRRSVTGGAGGAPTVSGMGFISYASRDGIGTITIDRPEKKNAMTYAMLGELWDALDEGAADDGARALILTGVPGAFCAGTDLSDLQDTPSDQRSGGGARRARAGVAADGLPEADRVRRRRAGDRDGRRVHVDVRRAHRHAPGPVRLGVRAPRPRARHRRRHVDPAAADRRPGDGAPAVLGRDHVRRGHGRDGLPRDDRRARGAARPRRARRPPGSPPARRSPSARPRRCCTPASVARSTTTSGQPRRHGALLPRPRTTRRASPRSSNAAPPTSPAADPRPSPHPSVSCIRVFRAGATRTKHSDAAKHSDEVSRGGAAADRAAGGGGVGEGLGALGDALLGRRPTPHGGDEERQRREHAASPT